MPTDPLIADLEIELTARQRQKLILDPITFPDDHDLSDFAEFVLTVRTDPDWCEGSGGRAGSDKASAAWARPVQDGWAVLGTVAGTVVGDTVEFEFDEDFGLEPGRKRYAFDVKGDGGSAGPVQLRSPVWLDVRPSLWS